MKILIAMIQQLDINGDSAGPIIVCVISVLYCLLDMYILIRQVPFTKIYKINAHIMALSILLVLSIISPVWLI